MKKTILFLLLTALFLTAAGAEKKSPAEFQVRLVLTKARNTAEQFAGILPNRPPLVPMVKQVVPEEPFRIEIIFSGAASIDNKVAIEGKLTMLGPEGKKQEVPLPEITLRDIAADFQGIVLYPKTLDAVYHQADPPGTYDFQVEFCDKHSGRRAYSQTAVELKREIKPDPAQKALMKLQNYYAAPAPEYLLPGFREYLERIPYLKDKEKEMFNPLPQLAVFCYLLQDNPQYIPAFGAMVRKLPPEERYYGAMVLNFASEKTAAELTKEERLALNRKFPLNPFEVMEISMPWQVEVCRAEFIIRGNRKPVMKIVEAMSLVTDCLPPQDFNKLQNPTPEQRRQMRNWLTAVSAKLSAENMAKEHRLAAFYLEAALKRGEIKNPGAKALTAAALGMKVKLKRSAGTGTPEKPEAKPDTKPATGGADR